MTSSSLAAASASGSFCTFRPATRELWGCVEGLSVVPINRKKVAQWLTEFPGAMHSTSDAPKFKRDDGHFA
ncbi:hypothetical protein ABEG74_02405 [Pantoea agglomerans]|uniref:hypothetical protein n=1 Tax=Enterobacter agglomerans TaxID=549 RepID=UPI00045CED96|nr:hypothetical protein [Pantoea agglomerans]KDA94980.1 hypothetical protein T296_08550 [Pantoea agglomerans Eh318]MDF9908672.1 hypothetical protein [Pantoea brenneri]